MKKRITNIKTFGKIISKRSNKLDFSDFHDCKECARYFKSINQMYRSHIVSPENQVKMDNGEIWCKECASKLTNQK